MSILGKLKGWAEKEARKSAPVDPASFDDPAALRTQWTPLVPGGSNFRTHGLVAVDGHRLQLNKSIGMHLFGAVFLLSGLGAMGFGAVSGEWLVGLFGVPFAAIGVAVVWPRRIVFDGSTRQFSSPKGVVAFSAIQAIQILREYVQSSEDPSYFSYEINLVLQDGARVHVVDHGDLASIRDDAERLRALIGCKLWDAAPS